MFQVIVRDEAHHQKDKVYMLTRPVRLMDFLQSHHYHVESPCGGNGSCGKCLVQMNGKAVRACKTFLDQECILSLREQQIEHTSAIFDIQIDSDDSCSISRSTDYSSVCSESVSQDICPVPTVIGGAVDLGTTTVEVRIYELGSGRLLGSRSEWNCQISYGGDVISRIQYCMTHERGLAILSRGIRRQVRLILRELMEKAVCGGNRTPVLRGLVVAGNTAMQHIFAGIDPSSLARAPFVPVTYFEGGEEFPLPEFKDCHVSFVPCISAFVGGDIVSGLSSLMSCGENGNMSWDDRHCFLFLDIGTNGEMALYKDGSISTCSVACGPAFEGAAISCGTRSIPGAMRHVRFNRNVALSRPDDPYMALSLDVIGRFDSQEPAEGCEAISQDCKVSDFKLKGVCGSGLIDLLALLLREEVVDRSGRLLPPQEVPDYMRGFLTEDADGNGIFWLDRKHTIGLTAEDVRHLQLAKGAVAAGIELLVKKCGIHYEQVEQVYLAGNFGRHLDIENMSVIGMIPGQLKKRVTALGNSSLTGAGMILRKKDMGEAAKLRQRSVYLELAQDPEFTDLFIDHMNF